MYLLINTGYVITLFSWDMPKTTPAPVPVPQPPPIHPPRHHIGVIHQTPAIKPFWPNLHPRVDKPEPKPSRIDPNANAITYRRSYVYNARPIIYPKISTPSYNRKNPKKTVKNCTFKNKEKCKRKGKGKKNRKGLKIHPSNNSEDNNIRVNVHSGTHWEKASPIKCEQGFRVTDDQKCEGK